MENYRKGDSFCDRNTHIEIMSIFVQKISTSMARTVGVDGFWELGTRSPPWPGCSLLMAVLTLKAQPRCKESASQGAWLKGQLWLHISRGDSMPPHPDSPPQQPAPPGCPCLSAHHCQFKAAPSLCSPPSVSAVMFDLG